MGPIVNSHPFTGRGIGRALFGGDSCMLHQQPNVDYKANMMIMIQVEVLRVPPIYRALLNDTRIIAPKLSTSDQSLRAELPLGAGSIGSVASSPSPPSPA